MENIPDMNIDQLGKVVEETLEIPLKVNGKDETVVVRKLSSGSTRKIRSKCTKTRMLGGQSQVDVNETELELLLVEAAIVSAPFDTSLEGIKGLPDEVFSYIATKWAEFANPTPAKKD